MQSLHTRGNRGAWYPKLFLCVQDITHVPNVANVPNLVNAPNVANVADVPNASNVPLYPDDRTGGQNCTNGPGLGLPCNMGVMSWMVILECCHIYWRGDVGPLHPIIRLVNKGG